jgi:RNA polymerase sigma-70 factor (ECF subfamily)
MNMSENQEISDSLLPPNIKDFKSLVENHKKMVYYIAFDMLHNHHDAEDVSQEVFIKVFSSIDRFRKDAKMSSWIYQITVNTCIDNLRRKRGKKEKIAEHVLHDAGEFHSPGSGTYQHDPAKNAEGQILQKKIDFALENVSPKERSVFVMRHYNGFKVHEIAETLGVSDGTVKSLLFRAVKKLKKELKDHMHIYTGNPGWKVTYE